MKVLARNYKEWKRISLKSLWQTYMKWTVGVNYSIPFNYIRLRPVFNAYNKLPLMAVPLSSPLFYVCLTCIFNELMIDWRYVCVCMCMSVLCLRGGCIFCVTFPALAFSYLLIVFVITLFCCLQPRDIYLQAEPFSVENGMLTPTFKTKRPQLRAHFKDTIKELYRKQPVAIW